MKGSTNMDTILEISAINEANAWKIVQELDIFSAWESIGAQVNLIGSLKMGLIMNHLDIDFHIYSNPVNIEQSFSAMARLARNHNVKHIEYRNLLNTEEACLEWHATYQTDVGELWQIDMIHINAGSKYDGYMEQVSDKIIELLTPENREIILRLKYETPPTESIPGIEYYKAVLEDGIKNFNEFIQWRNLNPIQGVLEWIPSHK